MKDGSVAESPISTLRVSIADMISLNVRTKGIKNLELPASLYQRMPEKAMALMATIPSGSFAVSIPGEIGWGRGCPIWKAAPPCAGGFVIAYGRKPNGRYEADAVQYQGTTYEFAEFIPFARQWVEQNVGMPKAIPGRYACFSPAREEWGVILRDSGYTGWDPTGMPSDVTSELRQSFQAQDGSGIVGRIPVYAEDKRHGEEILPAFVRAEVMLDSIFSPKGDWISFNEYQQIRADRARLPEVILPDFHDWLRLLTEESGFKCWIFRPGMMFGDRMEWWGDKCRRRTEHEGLDFATGLLRGGKICGMPEGVPARSMAAGEVVAVLDDFIGKTVVVRHSAVCRHDGYVFHSLLSHIQAQVSRLDCVSKGQIVGTVGKSTNASAPSHLHLTGAWIPSTLTAGEIRMDHIHPAFDPVVLVSFKNQLQGNPLCSLEPPEGEQAK